MSEQTFTVANPNDFQSVIAYILSVPAPRSSARLICLTGDLGAGKTTFTQELAKYLGVTEPVVSPTFVVMKSYELDGPGGQNLKDFARLIHIDAYRFDDPSEAGPLRLTELFKDPQNLICLEWPERIADILPTELIDVMIEIGAGEERKVVVRC